MSRILSVTLLLLTIVYEVSPSRDNQGGCVYSFQVWTPNEDVLQKIRSLENRCDGLSAQLDRQLATFRTKLLEETLNARNISHSVDKQLMQYRYDDVQLNLAMKDVRLELADMKSDNSRLWQAFDEAKLLSLGGVIRSSMIETPDMSDIRTDIQEITTLGSQLKNGVGDLKAEWLLIKREVQDIKSENMQLKFGQNDMKEDAMKLKNLIESIRADTQMLKENILGKRYKGSGNGEYKYEVTDVNLNSQLYGKLDFLSNQMSETSSELVRLRSDWTQTKRELMAMALNAGGMTEEEIEHWLSKLPSLQPTPRTEATFSTPPKDCHDLYKMGFHTSGVYQILPNRAKQLDNVYCEMINNTGWTLLQRRVDGSLSFTRMWMEYKFGFGNLYGEFWLGNEMMHLITTTKAYKLRVDMWDWEGNRGYAEYDTFKVESEKHKYRINVKDFNQNSDVGDSLSSHDNMAFSTEDSDNDHHPRNCAADNKGGWWFDSCWVSNLNGMYRPGRYKKEGSVHFSDGVVWYTWKQKEDYSLKAVEMKVRPLYL